MEWKMDKNRVKGTVDQAVGAAKDAAGRVTGDDKLRAEGKLEKAKGKLEVAVGKVEDVVRDLRDR
jgi:uncharacterized protein YjbJ (UPF0337 family)